MVDLFIAKPFHKINVKKAIMVIVIIQQVFKFKLK